jgi:hypothetical protein
MLIKIRGFTLEIDGQFVRLGRLELWLERSGYKPKGLFEVMRGEVSGVAEVFAMGRKITVCWV